MGGAVGNLIDRVRLGYVVDFVDVYWARTTGRPSTWPTPRSRSGVAAPDPGHAALAASPDARAGAGIGGAASPPEDD